MSKLFKDYEPDTTLGTDLEVNCTTCRKNQCGMCSEHGCCVGKGTNCINTEKRAYEAMGLVYVEK